ncbi:hypothetical protein ACHAWF_009893 [Thalassiosira exigua]
MSESDGPSCRSETASNISANGMQSKQDRRDSSSSASPASSTSTQWPSEQASPNSSQDEVTHLQDVLDRALHDPFSSHPEIAAHLKSKVDEHCRQAARKIYEADVLLVITGAGFSADSGLATYIDVADIDAYRSRGWRYRDLCRPSTFADFSSLEVGGRGVQSSASAQRFEEEQSDAGRGNCESLESKEMRCKIEPVGDKDNGEDHHEMLHSWENFERSTLECPTSLPDEDDIHHPQYFYGFWGQCCNDYRRVKPHDGYNILARWGRDKNLVPSKYGDCKDISDDNGTEWTPSAASEQVRNITYMLEKGGNKDSDSSDGSISFRSKNDDEEEPYYVDPDKRAGAFFLFTSNVDAHSFDVFESHEIRECHGNVECWQCHNFACGTNATLNDGGSLDGIESSACSVDDSNVMKNEPAQKRRLWRLPMNHHFVVDCNTMKAPFSKAQSTRKSEDVQTSSAATKLAGSLASGPASKRRKSAMQDCVDSSTSTVNNQGEIFGVRPDADSAKGTFDISTQLGGMMENTLYNHLAKENRELKSCNASEENIGCSNHSQPAHIGEVHGKPRQYPLLHMQAPKMNSAQNKESTDSQNYYLQIPATENWPRCPRCNEAARPAVLMFEDLDWVYNLKQERRWQLWCHSLLTLCKRRGRNDGENTMVDWSSSQPQTGHKSPLRVAILEIGCGYNVPTCRAIAERLVGELSGCGGDPTLIRINPSHPEPDDHYVEDFVISIMEKGLASLKAIDKHYCELTQGGTSE